MPNGIVHVLFWLDTEDYLAPETDDAALRLAQMFAERGVRGTFKLVGEKARALERRGRRDVIDALKAQDVGYHSDFHSRHPTVAEYLVDADWDEGVAEFIRREEPGVKDVERIFGVRPSCYGQGGGNWVPQGYGALRHWRIPAYVSGNSFVALDGKPFVFCGVLAVSRVEGMSIGFDIDKPDNLSKVKAWFERLYERLAREGGGLISIGMHPCTWVKDNQFWDANYKRGRNPLDSGWLEPALKSADRIEAGYRNFGEFVDRVLAHPKARIVPAGELPTIYRDRFRDGEVTCGDVAELARAAAEEISFTPLHGGFLSAAETFSLVAMALRHRYESGEFAQTLPVRTILGPVRDVETDAGPDPICPPVFEAAVRDACEYVEHHGRVPSEIWVGVSRLCPADFLATAARVLIGFQEGKSPGEVTLVKGKAKCRGYVKREYADAAWQWQIFAEGFSSPKALELTELQSWTLKPAVPT